MRLEDLFYGAKRRLGFGPWSRDYFERRFTVRDPWAYETSEYEITKYRRTLEAIPNVAGAQILEIGCAEGVFTAWLAEKGGDILAVDISERALIRAKQRCAAWPDVRFACFDIARTPVRGAFDVVLCAEVLYYLHRRGLCVARDYLVSALKPQGRAILVHPVKDAAEMDPIFSAHPFLRKVAERTWSDTPRAYTITVFEKMP
jgi:2-polyprenyl-3-methyl-5-hydroxy-6-metoxy-1,4-benzoquinol methylase